MKYFGLIGFIFLIAFAITAIAMLLIYGYIKFRRKRKEKSTVERKRTYRKN